MKGIFPILGCGFEMCMVTLDELVFIDSWMAILWSVAIVLGSIGQKFSPWNYHKINTPKLHLFLYLIYPSNMLHFSIFIWSEILPYGSIRILWNNIFLIEYRVFGTRLLLINFLNERPRGFARFRMPSLPKKKKGIFSDFRWKNDGVVLMGFLWETG